MQELRFEESANVNEKALSLNDKNYDVWSNLLACYTWLKRSEKAADARRHLVVLLQQAIKLDSQNAYAHVTLATVYAAEHEREKSISNVQTALALTPDDPDTLLNTADTYELLGDHRQAVMYLQRGLKDGLKEGRLRIDPDIQNVLKDPTFRYIAKR